MERPWLLLRHVLDGGPSQPDLRAVLAQAFAEARAQHGAVAEAEADAQAQEEQHAGGEEAEEHQRVPMERPWLLLRRVLDVGPSPPGLRANTEERTMFVQAFAEARAQHGAVAEAEADDAQAQEEQHAGGEEAEMHDAAAIEALEEALFDATLNIHLSEGQHMSMAAAGRGADFTITVERPPRFSSLFAGLRSHPDQQRPDMYPYIIATGRFCLLVHFAVAPYYGTNFDQEPNRSHLVMVHHFRWDDNGAEIVACGEKIPDRRHCSFDIDYDVDDLPVLRNIESVGLVCYGEETYHYEIAELIVTTDDPRAVVVLYDGDVWDGFICHNPLLAMDHPRDWVPHGTVTINSTVFWFDLSWGLISCDVNKLPLLQAVLYFHPLPPGRVLRAEAGAQQDIHCRHCISISENLLRYVEIILSPDGDDEAATVNMWYQDLDDISWQWRTNYSERFGDIWEHESYDQTGLPQNPPMLVGVSPVDSSVVYFSLDQRLFGVNVPEHTVVHCEQYDPLKRPGPDDEPVTSRYLITWNLDADGDALLALKPLEEREDVHATSLE